MQLNPLQKRRIYDDYVSDEPKPVQMDQWCAQKATEYSVSPKVVSAIVAQYAEHEDMAIRAATVTHHRKLASLVGASQVAALKTLTRNLTAHTKKVITNKLGDIVGEIILPDAPTQVRAAAEILKVHGAYAPEKLELTNADDPSKLSHDALREEITKLITEVTGPPQGSESSPSGERSPVLR